MPIDQTTYFKAKAKTIAQRNSKSPEDSQSDPSSRICSDIYHRLSLTAYTLAAEIVDLRQLILSRRLDYLAFNDPTACLNETDRDNFDKESEKALSLVGGAIRNLSSCVSREKFNYPDEKLHLTLVCDLINNHLKEIFNIVTQMRKLRVKNNQMKQRVWKLSSLVEAADAKREKNNTGKLSIEEGIRRRIVGKVSNWNSSEDVDGITTTAVGSTEVESYKPVEQQEEEYSFSPAERQQLMMENERMMEKFSHADAEMEILERHVVEIQQLQETFAEKLMDQEKDIELINETAINTTENLRDGNEWIRQAISNSAGRRVIVLFCIIVITFTLLFIDWYHP